MPGDPAGITNLQAWAISADGRTVLFSYWQTLSELFLAEGLK